MKVTRIFAVCTMTCLVLALAAPASADYAGSVSKEEMKEFIHRLQFGDLPSLFRTDFPQIEKKMKVADKC